MEELKLESSKINNNYISSLSFKGQRDKIFSTGKKVDKYYQRAFVEEL